MVIYIIVATFLFGVAFFVRLPNKHKGAYLLLSLILILFDGLRWESGTDWENYYQYYSYSLQEDNRHFEIGYLIINRLIRSITYNYTVFLLIHALCLYLCLGTFFKKNSYAPLLSLALFFVLFVPYQGMNRQYLAICFCLIAFNYLIDGRKRLFTILVLLGCLFHVTAFIFLIGLVFRRQYKNLTYILLIVSAILVGNLGFVKAIVDMGVSSLGPRVSLLLDFYSQQDLSEQSFWGLLFAYFRRLSILIPMFFHMQKNKLPRTIVLAINYYFVGFIVYILFNGTALQIMVSRGNVYFMLFECLLIPYLIYVYRRKLSKEFLFLAVYLVSIGSMVKGIQHYDVLGKGQNPFIPYKTIYYNTDVQKNTN